VVVATLVVPTAHKAWFGGALFLSAALLYIAQIAQTILQTTRQNWRDFRLAAAASVVRAFAPPLLYVATGAGLPALVGGFCLHAGLAAAIGLFVLQPAWRRSAHAASPASLTTYEGPLFMMLAISGWVLAGLNRWLVTAFFDPDQAGYFVLASNVGTLLPSMLGVMLLQYFQPTWFAVETYTGDEARALLKRVDGVALGFTVLALASTAALYFGMPLLMGTLIDSRYAPAAAAILPAGFFATAIAIGLFYHAMLLAAKRERACGPADLAGAVVLCLGCVAGAAAGWDALMTWLVISPVVPWLVNRSVARYYLQRPA
jgi:hypothetical protein